MTGESSAVSWRPAALVGGGAVSDTSRVVESTLCVQNDVCIIRYVRVMCYVNIKYMYCLLPSQ